MKDKDGYVIAIIVLSLLLLMSLIAIGYLAVIATDLRDTAMMHENSLGVCNIDLKQVQKENEDLRKRLANE